MKELPRIPKSEWFVMDVLWKESPLKADAVIERLKDIPWSERTVKTLLNRLLNKGALGYEKEGRCYLYYPIVEKSEMVEKETKEFMKKVFDNDADQMYTSLSKVVKPSAEALDQMK